MSLSCMDFYDVYKERTIEDFSDPLTGEEYSVVNTSSMLFDSVSRIVRAVAILEKDSKEYFEMPSSKYKDSLVFSKAEQCILSAVSINYVELERDMVLFKVNPYISLFVDCYKELKPANPLKAEPSEMSECFSGLRLFVRTLRDRLKGSELKRKNSAHLRSSNKNYLGLVGYIDSLFERYSRMLIVRVDFSYGKGRLDLEGYSECDP